MCSANDNEKPPRAWPMGLLRLLPLPALASLASRMRYPLLLPPVPVRPRGLHSSSSLRRFASRFSHFRNELFKAIFPGRPVELPLKSKSKSYNHFKHSQGWREGGGGDGRAMPDNIIRHMQTERTTKVALMMSCVPPCCRCPLGWH